MSTYASLCACKHLLAGHRAIPGAADRYRCKLCPCEVGADHAHIPLTKQQYERLPFEVREAAAS